MLITFYRNRSEDKSTPSSTVVESTGSTVYTALLIRVGTLLSNMESGKVNWQNFLKRLSKDVQVAERSLAHDDEVK